MLLGLGIGLLNSRVYLFLISSGGFALLFTYTIIMATHIRFRKRNGCPPQGKCQMPGFPFTSWIVLLSMVIIIISMLFIKGQSSGLITGIIMVAMFSLIYMALRFIKGYQRNNIHNESFFNKPQLTTEFSKELTEETNDKDKNKTDRKK